MDQLKKPTVFFVGEKKKDAPSVSTITKEQMEQMQEDVNRYLREKL